MATEITCAVPDGADPDERIEAVGGPGWRKDEEVVIAEIVEGREYFVVLAHVRVTVVVAEFEGRTFLITDPGAAAENQLFSLPRCPAERAVAPAQSTEL